MQVTSEWCTSYLLLYKISPKLGKLHKHLWSHTVSETQESANGLVKWFSFWISREVAVKLLAGAQVILRLTGAAESGSKFTLLLVGRLSGSLALGRDFSSYPCRPFCKASQSQRSKRERSLHPNQKPRLLFITSFPKQFYVISGKQVPSFKDKHQRIHVYNLKTMEGSWLGKKLLKRIFS